MSKKKTKKKHIGSFLLGLIVTAFAIFGFVKAVMLVADKDMTVSNLSSKNAEYEEFLEPFVLIDPSPFDDVSTADTVDLIDAAVSALILDSEKINTYEVFEGEVTGLLVPQKDIEQYFAKLFGNETVLSHTAVTDSFYGVVYNSEKKSYVIPITSVDPLYTPKVYEAEKTGSSITLTVGYIIGSEWAQIENGQYTAPSPAKYMNITLREDSDGYHIGSLSNTAMAEVAEPEKTVPVSTTAPVIVTTERVTDESSSETSEGHSESETSETSAVAG